jgi:N-acetylglucosamine-6-sulfatase
LPDRRAYYKEEAMKREGPRKPLFAVTLSIVVFLLLFTWTAIGSTSIQAQTIHPNIIVIVTDDQRWDTLAYMPHLQSQLVAQGVTFANAFAPTSLCCPARASILSGQYAHTHGVLDNAGAINFFDDSATLATWLHDASYRTALLGKYLNGYTTTYIPPGWDEWRAFTQREESYYYDYTLNENGVSVHYGTQPADYSTDVLAAKATAFIHASAGTPFFLYLAPAAPHAPFTPAPRHAGAFADVAPWRPPSYNEADVSDKPAWLQTQWPLGDEKVDNQHIGQLETALAVDDALAGILQALDDTGQRSNTVIIFLSDQGVAWGEHRWDSKRCPYEECIRMPLVMLYPGVTTPAIIRSEIVLNIDLAPTILELAGVSIPPSIEGNSLLPLLNNTAVNWRSDFLLEQWQGGSQVTSYTGMRNAAWKYVEYETGETELYDLAADPYELVNVAANPAYAQVLATLNGRLDELKGLIGSTPTPDTRTTPSPPPSSTQQPRSTPAVTQTPIRRTPVP